MVRVIFDTSALHDLAPRDPTSQQLRHLVDKGKVEIYVPRMVRRELESQLLNNLQKALERIPALDWLSDDSFSKFEGLRASTDRVRFRSEVVKNLSDWLGQLQAKEVTTDAADAEEVFDRYFKGQPPFGAPKSRQDLPDAFIFSAVKRLTEPAPASVHFVGGDKKLRSACASLPRVSVHETIQSFLGIEGLRTIDDYHTSLALQYLDEIFSMIEPSLKDGVIGTDLADVSDNSEQHAGVITAIEHVDGMGFDASDALPLDDDSVEIPFYCDMEVHADSSEDASAITWHADEITSLRLRVHVEGWVNVTWRPKGASLEPSQASLRKVTSIGLVD